MARVKSDKPKRNVWTDESPYGTYDKYTPGFNRESFRAAWEEAATAKVIIKDETRSRYSAWN